MSEKVPNVVTRQQGCAQKCQERGHPSKPYSHPMVPTPISQLTPVPQVSQNPNSNQESGNKSNVPGLIEPGERTCSS